MRRSLSILLTGGLLILGSLGLASGATAATIAPTTTCSNGVDNTGGLGLICEVSIVNTITPSGGSATVTVRECHGAAGNPQASCSTQTMVLTAPVTAVTQCNDAINGGGGTLRCSVQVRNDFVGLSPAPTAATVNQCVGSGGGITTGCDPFPATTSGATITQCNGSANGGTLVGLTCTATGTASSANGVTINQCNGSANGGGALVICSASITSGAASPTAAPTGAAPTGATPTGAAPTGAAPTGAAPTAAASPASPSLPPTDVLGTTDASGSGPAAPSFIAAVSVLALLYLASRRPLSRH